MTVGGLVDCGVMHDNQFSVLRCPDIDLDKISTELDGGLICGNSVFRVVIVLATMRNGNHGARLRKTYA